MLPGVGPPMIAFHFSPSRSRDVAESLLGDYSGTIIRDSYVAYEKLDCEVACCWAHVRRRFLQAVESGYTKAEAPLKLIQALYRIERVAKERAEKKGTETALFQERKNARRQSQKLVQEFFADNVQKIAHISLDGDCCLPKTHLSLKCLRNRALTCFFRFRFPAGVCTILVI